MDIVKRVVENNDKQRFIISDDGKIIRANHGHSITVNFELESRTPPDVLYHGTAIRFIDSIMKRRIKDSEKAICVLSVALTKV
jgi:putative RNA 2'-phosphotransferase